MGHYGGYTEKDFEALLTLLSTIKGKFLLSSYPSDVLSKYIETNGWQCYEKQSKIAVTHLTNRTKTECLTANYDMMRLMPD